MESYPIARLHSSKRQLIRSSIEKEFVEPLLSITLIIEISIIYRHGINSRYSHPLSEMLLMSVDVNGEAGIRTRDTGMTPYSGLANRRFQPLSHLSRRLICNLIL